MRRSGRYCWSCGCRRPNERFSRRSSLRSLCREYYRLGPAELAYRQVVVNIDRALRHGELIPRRHRPMIEKMLQHGDARVRAYVASVIERDAQVRRELAEAYREDELFEPCIPCINDNAAESSWMSGAPNEADDIPF